MRREGVRKKQMLRAYFVRIKVIFVDFHDEDQITKTYIISYGTIFLNEHDKFGGNDRDLTFYFRSK